jgi:hypothetical protein
MTMRMGEYKGEEGHGYASIDFSRGGDTVDI